MFNSYTNSKIRTNLIISLVTQLRIFSLEVEDSILQYCLLFERKVDQM